MYLCLSIIFRRFGSNEKQGFRLKSDEEVLELYETKLSNMKIKTNDFVSLTKEETKEIRIKMITS